MRRTLTRQELYDLVWERAMTKVAAELGISDVALRKQCLKHDVPVPNARYRGLANAGRPAPRIPLPPSAAAGADRIVIHSYSQRQPDEVAAAIEAARALVVPATRLDRGDGLVRRSIAAARRDTFSRDGSIRCREPDLFRIRAHPDTIAGVAELLNGLVYAARARGYSLSSGREGLAMVVDAERIDFSVNQVIRKVPPPSGSRIPEYMWWRRPEAYAPTGETILEMVTWGSRASAQRRFSDRSGRPLVDRIGDILVSFAAHAAGMVVARLEDEVRMAAEQLEQSRRRRAAELEAHDEGRRSYLADKLRVFDGRERLISLIALVEAQPALGVDRFLETARAELAKLENSISAETIADDMARLPAFADAAYAANTYAESD